MGRLHRAASRLAVPEATMNHIGGDQRGLSLAIDELDR